MASVFTANSSQVMVDGNAVEGVQGIDYRVQRQQGDVFALGSAERITSYYGATRVDGRLQVASANPALDTLTNSGSSFQVVVTLAHGETQRSVAFDDCFMTNKEFALNTGGHGETIYLFSATRVREEDSSGA